MVVAAAQPVGGIDLGSLPRQGCRTGSEVWIGAVLGAAMIGLVGVLPCLLLSTDSALLRDGQLTPTLRTMLGFACGGLLGNALVHLLPEAYRTLRGYEHGELKFMGLIPVATGDAHGFNEFTYVGLWSILGILTFIILEKLVNAHGDGESDGSDDESADGSGESAGPTAASTADADGGTGLRQRGSRLHSNPDSDANGTTVTARPPSRGSDEGRRRVSLPNLPASLKVDPAGYLNLLVNSMDNFTHGLAVAGSFCVSNWAGVTTTLAIVIHEVPHEIGDYAILIRSGFDTRQAILSQLLTSAGGIFGAVFGLLCASAEREAIWILPFASGGFLYIALVSLIPDMYEQETPGFAWWRDVLNVAGGMVLVTITLVLEDYYGSDHGHGHSHSH